MDNLTETSENRQPSSVPHKVINPFEPDMGRKINTTGKKSAIYINRKELTLAKIYRKSSPELNRQIAAMEKFGGGLLINGERGEIKLSGLKSILTDGNNRIIGFQQDIIGGSSLKEIKDKYEGNPPFSKKAGQEALRALQAMHKMGLEHGDLTVGFGFSATEGNLMFSLNNNGEYVFSGFVDYGSNYDGKIDVQRMKNEEKAFERYLINNGLLPIPVVPQKPVPGNQS